MDILPTIPNTSKIDIIDTQTLEMATSKLSHLNKQLDALQAHKEAKTRPINEALKKIRDDYRPHEELLTQAIASLKQSINTYATQQAKIALQREQSILADKRTKLTTKMQQLAKIEQSATSSKVTTEAGSITFTTVKKYRITNAQDIPRAYLMPDDAKIKEAMKQNPQPNVPGIEWYEEKTLRNYR